MRDSTDISGEYMFWELNIILPGTNYLFCLAAIPNSSDMKVGEREVVYLMDITSFLVITGAWKPVLG